MQLRFLPATPRRQRGLSLTEALVTVVILSFAALGYASLQLRSLSANAGAQWRSQATTLAYEASDRLRSNLPGVSAGAYKNFVPTSGSEQSVGAPSAVPNCTVQSPCTPARMATRDYADWSTKISTALPSGIGAICADSTPDDGTASTPACDGVGSRLAVKVFWSERGSAQRYVSVVEP